MFRLNAKSVRRARFFLGLPFFGFVASLTIDLTLDIHDAGKADEQHREQGDENQNENGHAAGHPSSITGQRCEV